MVQELQVLRCFACETFQSHIVKKSNKKWECKICGAKQTLKQVYGKGSGKDCRIHTQKLNSLKGKKEEIETFSHDAKKIDEHGETERVIAINDHHVSGSSTNVFKRTSKWAEFVDESETSISQNYITKPERNGVKTLDNFDKKVKKRKIRDEFANEFIGSFDDFDSLDGNCSILNNTSKFTKKLKLNERCMSKNNSYRYSCSNNRSDIDNYKIPGVPEEEICNTSFRSFNQDYCKAGANWARGPAKEDKVNLAKIFSQNNTNLQNKEVKVSLKWANYIGEGEGLISGETFSKESIYTHQSGIELSFDKLKYSVDCPQDKKDSDSFNPFGQVSNDRKTEPSSNLKCIASTEVERAQSSWIGGTSTHKLVATVKRSVQSNNNFIPITSSSFCRKSSYNCENDDTVKIMDQYCKGIENAKEMSRQVEKSNSVSVPLLPAFDQSNEISDSEFQLDF